MRRKLGGGRQIADMLSALIADMGRLKQKLELWGANVRRCAFLGSSTQRLRPPSIASERLLRALFLQTLYTIRSERQLMEQYHNLLYRWFVGLGVDDPVWVPTVFTKNRDRLFWPSFSPTSRCVVSGVFPPSRSERY